MKSLCIILSVVVVGIFLFTSTLFGQSTQSEKFNYISPVPGSKYVNPENNIAFRHGEPLDINSVRSSLIHVEGSMRGEVSGTIKFSKDQKTLIFLPDQKYTYNEIITVNLGPGILTSTGKTLEGVSFKFQVKEKDNLLMLQKFYETEFEEEENLLSELDDINEPPFHSPALNVHGERLTPEGMPIPNIYAFDNPADGYVFTTPRPSGGAPYNPYLMVLDNYGTPVFYREWPRRGNDFKTIPNDQLTFCDFDNNNTSVNKYLVMDNKYNITDTLLMGNGYIIDQHDVIMLENGNHFLMAYDPQPIGMDTVVEGGDPNATVVGFVIQELDADHNVIFQWRSWDHFEITDANHTDFLSSRIDYVHGNAFEIDSDNQLLMSNRNMEEITKINRNTGEIIWRFGLHAKNNMFDFTNDTVGFSWQHDIRRLANGNVTVYDNGNYHTPKFSQAVEYQLDEVNFKATLVWNFIHDPVVYGRATGANRRLYNDNSFICWGLTWPINYSEVRQDGHLAWELNWPQNVWDYRAFKIDWETDLFETSLDEIDYGEYDDYVPWPRIVVLTNNGTEDVVITSTTNRSAVYYLTTPLPLTIPPNETKNIVVNFFPEHPGIYNDVLTINSESMYADTLPQLIAKQIKLSGFVEDLIAPVANIIPADGSTEVPQGTTINIHFNEPVVKPGGATINPSDIPYMVTIKENDENGEEVDYHGYINAWKDEIIIEPGYLKPSYQYYVALKEDVVSDESGNVLNQQTVSTFTTADEEAPTLVITPQDSATDVSTLSVLTFTFDEPVKLASGEEITPDNISEIVMLKKTDFEGEDVNYSGTMNDERTIITVQPDTLIILQQYYIEVVGGSVADDAGNTMDESQTSIFTTMDDTGIGEDNLSDMIKIFPNPHKGKITLELDISGSKNIQVMDAYGKLVYSIEDVNDPSYKIDISNEPNGIYLIRVFLKEQNQTIDLKTIKL